jgi:hypothetical protein
MKYDGSYDQEGLMSDNHDPVPQDKLAIFQGKGAPSLEESGMVVDRSFVEPASMEELFNERTMGDASSSVPFRQAGDDGMSLVQIWFPPGFLLPRHSHSADCLYYIVAGSIVMGTRELGSGDGFFVPSEHPYTYRVGPKGVKLLEFRHSTAFDTKFHQKDAARFAEKAAASLAEAVAANGSA